MPDQNPLDVEAIRARLDAATATDGRSIGAIQNGKKELRRHAPTDLRRLLDENARLNADRNSLLAELNERRVRASMLHRLLKGTIHSDLLATLDELSKRRQLAAPEMPRPPAEEAQERSETPGTGSGRGTGVLEAENSAQADDDSWLSDVAESVRPVHYREAAASLRKYAFTQPDATGVQDHTRCAYCAGLAQAANLLDSVARDFDDEAGR